MDLLTLKETAKCLNVRMITIRRSIADGHLPAEKVNGDVRVRRDALDQLSSPVQAPDSHRRRSHARGRAFTSDDPLWAIVGIGQSAEPTNVAAEKDDYLADAFDSSGR